MATRILAVPQEHHDQQPQMDATLALARVTPLCEVNSKQSITRYWISHYDTIVLQAM